MKAQPYRVLLNQLVSVSASDRFIGPIPKWHAHLNSYLLDPAALPHRAFSIFLFNSNNQLLLQKRSAEKKTFPLAWTNTCCSHPNMVEYQDGTKGVEGVREALHRALHRELRMDLQGQRFWLVDKILYKAEGKKEQFGEYEVDYVYICKLNTPSIEFTAVTEEIGDTHWVEKPKLAEFIEQKQQTEGAYFTPWFMKMYNHGLLDVWWDMAIKNQLQDVSQEDTLPVRQL